ncbi:hypothetical protein HO660_08655 [Streptococcus suis]|nr:hypothetical protein [Streptococcus suis]NQH22209.1 hypothetical protein [Streptococcus suis]HEL1600628.1 hypothetical protein [Streptococcus suis]HEL9646542.1 hypothetical protein [Streptococcus suis]HEM2799387.1 hypothetical protein [Streptococcus suis]HEM3208932.1 hypothetical protein [Streptococcus suis 22083]
MLVSVVISEAWVVDVSVDEEDAVDSTEELVSVWVEDVVSELELVESCTSVNGLSLDDWLGLVAMDDEMVVLGDVEEAVVFAVKV